MVANRFVRSSAVSTKPKELLQGARDVMKGSRMKQIFVRKLGQARSIVRTQTLAARRKTIERTDLAPGDFAEYKAAFDVPATTVTAVFPLASGELIDDDHFVVELELLNEAGHLIKRDDLNTSYSRLLQSPYAYVKNAGGAIKTPIVSADHQNISNARLRVRLWKKSIESTGLDVLGPLLVIGTVEHPSRTIIKKATLV